MDKIKQNRHGGEVKSYLLVLLNFRFFIYLFILFIFLILPLFFFFKESIAPL